jgi:hypothetical protein
MQPGRDHTAVVGDEQIPGGKVFTDLVKMAMLDGARGPIQNQQPAVIAWIHRLLGDEFRGQIIVEQISLQG